MIYGNLNVKETKGANTAKIQRALQVLRETDVTGWEVGRYPIDGEDLILQIVETTTGEKKDFAPEVHKDYIDVHCMLEGKELIGYFPYTESLTVLEDKLEENDIVFFKECDEVREIDLPLYKGDYAVFFPEDVHRPCGQVEQPEKIRKIVLKVRVASL